MTPKTLFAVLALVLLSFALGFQLFPDSGESGSAHAARRDEVPEKGRLLAFAWPAAGTTRVHEERELSGESASFTYDLTLEPDGSEGGRIVSLGRAEYPAAPEAAPFLTAIPHLRIAPDGSLVGFLDRELVLATLERELVAAGMDEESARQARTLTEMPAVQAVTTKRAAEAWNAWAGAWGGLHVYEGWESELELPVRFGEDRAELPLIVTARCTEHTSPGEGGTQETVRLELTSRYDSEGLLRSVTEDMQATGIEFSGELLDTTRVDHVEGVFQVEGLLPLEVELWSQLTVITDSGEGPVTERSVDRRRFTFDWRAN